MKSVGMPIVKSLLLLVPFFLGYILGNLQFGVLMSRWFRKEDPRLTGSGNIGASNVYRLSGFAMGFAVFVLDLLKGILAFYGSLWMIGENASWDSIFSSSFLGAFLGHVFPCQTRKGFKLLATFFTLYLCFYSFIDILSPAEHSLFFSHVSLLKVTNGDMSWITYFILFMECICFFGISLFLGFISFFSWNHPTLEVLLSSLVLCGIAFEKINAINCNFFLLLSFIAVLIKNNAILKGGKGVAVFLGGAIIFHPVLAICSMILWVISARLIRYASAASLLTGSFFVVALLYHYAEYQPYSSLWCLSHSLVIGSFLTMLLLMIYTHRHNLERLSQHKESKLFS